MGWDKQGQQVNAMYFGTRVSGVVDSSRVALGGRVKHYVILDELVQLPWASISKAARVAVYEDDLV